MISNCCRFLLISSLLGISALVAGQRLQEDESCLVEGKESVCRLITNCPTAPKAIRQRRPPPICSFRGNTAIVCCPVENSDTQQQSTRRPVTQSESTTKPVSSTSARPSNFGSLSRKKCEEYAKSVYQEADVLLLPGAKPISVDTCVRVEQPLIVGGMEAKPKEYPHMALIGYGETTPEWLCGGSLISEKFVLSAAHCTVPTRKWGPARWVRLGELNLGTDLDDADPIDLRIVARHNHPQYSSVTFYNDLALYELERSMTFNAYIRPICLNVNDEISDKTAIASGWGKTAWGGPTSDHLMKVRLNLVSRSNCNMSYASAIGTRIPQGILQSQLCSGDEPGKDTCQGDSGGPLQLPINNPYCMFDLVGVTSFGKQCGMSTPGVYTRVSEFIPWIESVVWPNEI